MASPPAVDRLPLTAAQQGVWIGQQLDPVNPLYNAAEYLCIDGPLDTGLFEKALRRTVAEAHTLHARFHTGPHGLFQLLQPTDDWPLTHLDTSHHPDPRHAALVWMRTDLKTLVDLEKGPLFAHALITLGPDQHLWYHRAHHIALDGYGFSVIANRTAQHYTALSTGRPDTTPPLGPLRPLVDDDFGYQHSTQNDRDRTFWTTRYADRPQAVSLSRYVAVPCGRLLRSSTQLPAQALDSWRAAAGPAGAGWAEAVIALIARHLHQHTGADEVILGLPVMGRWGPAARTPAMIMNIVPLRIPVHRGDALPDTVRAVAAELRAIRPHQRYRGEQLRRDLKLVGGRRRLVGPLVNVMPFDYRINFADSPARAYNLSTGAAFVEDMAIQLHARTDGEPLSLDIDANPNCYGPNELASYLGQLTDLLTGTSASASHP
ncbi:condensation domain-containing protein [Streptomyces sp. NPDC053431]|uniref:condensation domain-containing protein n=1 Tax=Streptomyces sp. NPDC053431 TaxID=3365703 RepID=UPI0037D38B1B